MGIGENRTLEYYDRQNTQNVLLLIIVITICIGGFIGNFHVVLVYTCRLRSKTTFKACIVWLAAIDLLNCVVVMPMDVTYLKHPYSVYTSSGCKLRHYLAQLVTFSAVAVTLVIAVDRYRKVCMPTCRQIRYREGRILCGILVLILALLLIPLPVMIGLEDVELKSENVTLQKCGIDESYKESIVPEVVITFFICLLYLASIAVVAIYFQLGKYLRQRNFKMYLPPVIARRISRKTTFSKADLKKMAADPSSHHMPPPSPESSSSESDSHYISEGPVLSKYSHKEMEWSVGAQEQDVQTDANSRKCSETCRHEYGASGQRNQGVVNMQSDGRKHDKVSAKNENGNSGASGINTRTEDKTNYVSFLVNKNDNSCTGTCDDQIRMLDLNNDCEIQKYTEETQVVSRTQITRLKRLGSTDSREPSKSTDVTLETTVDSLNEQTSATGQTVQQQPEVIEEHKSLAPKISTVSFSNRLSTNYKEMHELFLSEKRERRQKRNSTVVMMCYIIAVVCLLCLLPATVTFLVTFAGLDKTKYVYVLVRLGQRSPYFRSFFNPLIYGFLDNKFRRACADLYRFFPRKFVKGSGSGSRRLNQTSTFRTHYTINNMTRT